MSLRVSLTQHQWSQRGTAGHRVTVACAAPVLAIQGIDRDARSPAEAPHKRLRGRVPTDPGLMQLRCVSGSRPGRSGLLILDLARRQRTTPRDASNTLKGAPASQ